MGNGIVKFTNTNNLNDNNNASNQLKTHLANYISFYLNYNQKLINNQKKNIVNKRDLFMDSIYIKSWLSSKESTDLFNELVNIGEKSKPINTETAAKSKSKYPLWTKYYGLKRKIDGARALDRWGSYHESWLRVEEPTNLLKKICIKIRKEFNLSDDSVNSIVVNYYYDGENTYIPAHRDTTACLEEDSKIFCLSLGSSRDFVLCDNGDAGKYQKDKMKIIKEYRVNHGDIFAIGQQTNDSYLHAITQESEVKDLRISIIFRSVNKCFVDNNSKIEKEAIYMNGTKKFYHSECIITKGYDDIGKREHISDLINEREKMKLQKRIEIIIPPIKTDEIRDSQSLSPLGGRTSNTSSITNIEIEKDMTKYYLGVGVTVPV